MLERRRVERIEDVPLPFPLPFGSCAGGGDEESSSVVVVVLGTRKARTWPVARPTVRSGCPDSRPGRSARQNRSDGRGRVHMFVKKGEDVILCYVPCARVKWGLVLVAVVTIDGWM